MRKEPYILVTLGVSAIAVEAISLTDGEPGDFLITFINSLLA